MGPTKNCVGKTEEMFVALGDWQIERQGLIQFLETLDRSRFEPPDNVIKTHQAISRADAQRKNDDRKQAMESFETALAQIAKLRHSLPNR